MFIYLYSYERVKDTGILQYVHLPVELGESERYRNITIAAVQQLKFSMIFLLNLLNLLNFGLSQFNKKN